MSTTSSSSIHHNSTSTSTNTKDRKRSAHWTDLDTETLVNLLLRYKDAGRTADNGFKPEIWEEASILLEGNTYMGGPKTPDACKSRWQRLQRDYKAAKDMEAEPGFTWDRTTNRLSASAECWINAEKKLDSYKYRKIHLPTFDSIAILCANDSTRTRPRASKGRSSLGSISNASSMLSLSTTSTSNNQNGNGNGNGYQHNHMNDPSTTAEAMAQLQVQNDQNVYNWSASTGHTENVNGNGDQDGNGEGEFENAFGMPDGSQSFNLGQKRPLPFDPSILSPTINTNHGPGQPQNAMHHNLPISSGSPPKKPRPSHSQHKPHPMPGQFGHQQQMTPNHTHTPHMNPQQHHLPPAHTIPQQFYLPHSQPSQSSTSQLNMVNVPHSPEFNSAPTTHTHQNLLEPSMIQTPPPAPSSGIIRQFTPLTSTPSGSSSNIQGLTGVSINGNGNGPAGVGVGVPVPMEITNAGLSESQRLTKAILAVQNQQETFELGDEELIEIFNEFESNMNSGDTYLAIKKDSLRRMWLMKILKRRGTSTSNGNKK
ncbi:hypothetical protein I302_108394 [Kwoniella bestiolae CBS 10118]|uniref:Myb-like domain-containing protein n=1 Tax=Kwoniella bestiolae CBS 10118 TaxID=1296100 RepID=A0A1B9FVU1_9TREE|nr:hypothetical protein I302_07232 [Kwoniella bestiolae CBS 10118]OCF22885.1 hypothetical protein I302_07232 [Kwoniella bestiolae CBS 10118]